MTSENWRGYDQAALDAQYTARAAVPAFQQYVARWTADSAHTREKYACESGLAYGSSPAETVDVFPAEHGPAPIHIFFHGGYWKSLDKDLFSFIARPFVKRGAVAVIVNYALCPTVDMDELVRQCRASIAWVYKNAARFNGDAARITISGHSAGGHIVAMAAATDWRSFADTPADTVKGVVALSGLFDLETMRRTNLNVDLRLDPAQADRLSPVSVLPARPVPMVVAVGALESDEFRRQSRDYVGAWRSRGWACDHVEAPGHHHFSILDGFTDKHHPLCQAALRQMGLA